LAGFFGGLAGLQINSNEIDLDGDNGDVEIRLGLYSPLEIEAPAVDNDADSPGFDATIYVDAGALTVNIEGGWRLDGRLELATDSHRGAAQVYGTTMTVGGGEPGDGIFVGGGQDEAGLNTIHSDVVFTENAVVHLRGYNATLVLNGSVTNFRRDLGTVEEGSEYAGISFNGDTTTFAVPTRLNVAAGFLRGSVVLSEDLTVGETIVFDKEVHFTGPGRIIVEEQATAYLANGDSVEVPIVNHGTLYIRDYGEEVVSIASLKQTPTARLLYSFDARWGPPNRLDVAAGAVLDGALVVDAYDLRPGSASFDLLSAGGGIQGRFASYELPELPQGLFWRINYNPNDVAIEVVRLLQGDFNGNGSVEQGDLDLVLLNWGEDAMTPPEGWTSDLPGGTIDQEELDRVLLGWGDVAVFPSSQGAQGVPEPASMAMLAACLIGGILCKPGVGRVLIWAQRRAIAIRCP
jgi:hypothetical protein